VIFVSKLIPLKAKFQEVKNPNDKQQQIQPKNKNTTSECSKLLALLRRASSYKLLAINKHRKT